MKTKETLLPIPIPCSSFTPIPFQTYTLYFLFIYLFLIFKIFSNQPIKNCRHKLTRAPHHTLILPYFENQIQSLSLFLKSELSQIRMYFFRSRSLSLSLFLKSVSVFSKNNDSTRPIRDSVNSAEFPNGVVFVVFSAVEQLSPLISLFDFDSLRASEVLVNFVIMKPLSATSKLCFSLWKI